MRGFLEPAVTRHQTDHQKAFSALSRHRRAHLAKAAQTTLLKADQWARGVAATTDIAAALEAGMEKFLKTAASKNPS